MKNENYNKQLLQREIKKDVQKSRAQVLCNAFLTIYINIYKYKLS